MKWNNYRNCIEAQPSKILQMWKLFLAGSIICLAKKTLFQTRLTTFHSDTHQDRQMIKDNLEIGSSLLEMTYHAHHFQTVRLRNFNHWTQIHHWEAVFSGSVELQSQLTPSSPNGFEFLLDLRLLHGLINSFADIIRKFVQLEVQASPWSKIRTLNERSACHVHQLYPVTVTHGVWRNLFPSSSLNWRQSSKLIYIGKGVKNAVNASSKFSPLLLHLKNISFKFTDVVRSFVAIIGWQWMFFLRQLLHQLLNFLASFTSTLRCWVSFAYKLWSVPSHSETSLCGSTAYSRFVYWKAFMSLQVRSNSSAASTHQLRPIDAQWMLSLRFL